MMIPMYLFQKKNYIQKKGMNVLKARISKDK